MTKLYLSNMPPAMTEEQVRDLLSDVGDINEVEVIETVSPEGTKTSAAFLVPGNEDSAGQVYTNFSGYELMGRRLMVSPAAPPKELAPPTDEERQAADRIAGALQETETSAHHQILDIIRFCGTLFAEKLLEEATLIENAGGMMISETGKRRTIGGIFFKLAKDRMASRVRWFIFRPPERKKDKTKEQSQGEQSPAPKKEKAAKQEKAPKKQKPAPEPAPAPPSEPALSPEEAVQKLAELQTALHTAQENLTALKSGPATKQAGLFSAMKQVVELQRQVDSLLKAHPDLR